MRLTEDHFLGCWRTFRSLSPTLRYIHGNTKSAEFPGGSCPAVHLIWMPVPASLTLPPGQAQGRWGFLLAAANTSEMAEGVFDEGLSQMAAGNLRPSHDKAWAELWLQSTVEAVGSERLSRALIGCMFYLLSALPSIHDTSSSFGGISPGGLSNGGDGEDYWGHVFWDQVADPLLSIIHLELGLVQHPEMTLRSCNRTSGCTRASPCSIPSWPELC